MSGMVLKAGDVRPMTRGMRGLDLRDFAKTAEEVLAAARVQAERIIIEARLRAESERQAIRQQAHDEGHQAGVAEGQAAALAEARERFAAEQQALSSVLKDLLGKFQAQREQMYLAARRDVIVLAATIAGRVVGRLSEDNEIAPEAAITAAQEAVELVGKATEVTIRVHPADRQALEQLAKEVQDAAVSSRHIRLVDDPAVGRGGVIVETSDCTVDAQTESRVQRIADELVTNWRPRAKVLGLAEKTSKSQNVKTLKPDDAET
jgi:flagellar assembly protein FliH